MTEIDVDAVFAVYARVPSGLTFALYGESPTGIVETSELVAVLITDTELPVRFATYT